jgi:hypothetical protein
MDEVGKTPLACFPPMPIFVVAAVVSQATAPVGNLGLYGTYPQWPPTLLSASPLGCWIAGCSCLMCKKTHWRSASSRIVGPLAYLHARLMVIRRLVHLLSTPHLLLLPGYPSSRHLFLFFFLSPRTPPQPSRFLAAVFPCPPGPEHPLSFGGLALKYEPPTQLAPGCFQS